MDEHRRPGRPAKGKPRATVMASIVAATVDEMRTTLHRATMLLQSGGLDSDSKNAVYVRRFIGCARDFMELWEDV